MPDVHHQIRQEIRSTDPTTAAAYLNGAVHDATYSSRHRTTRFSQHGVGWLYVLRQLLLSLGKRSWIYREGHNRQVWVLESTWRGRRREAIGRGVEPSSPGENAAYLRGYFDAEGGIPLSAEARFYIQMVQKDRADLEKARNMLVDLGVDCGVLHNPSVRVDPDYWRFYVAARSHLQFIERVGSWHPRKRARLESERARLLGSTPLDALR